MLASPEITHEVYGKHKETWSQKEKELVHEKLNLHGIGDGTDDFDQMVTEIMCMVYVDGIRAGRLTCPCQN